MAALLLTVHAMPVLGMGVDAGPVVAIPPSFIAPTFSSNTLSYAWGPNYRNPFIASVSQPGGADIARHSIEFKHFDAWRYGHNFVDVILKRSSSVEPAAGGGAGALGFYSIVRAGLSINRMAGRSVIALGPLRDIDLQLGANLQSKNSDFAPNERSLYLGPNFQFGFGAGYLNIALQARQEWNHNGILGRNEDYDLGFNIEPVWSFPFHIGRASLVFEGYADYNTPKGRDTSGQQTRAELIARPQLKLDVSPWFGLAPNVLELGVGVEYWDNLFGKNGDRVPGARQSTPVISLGVHWPRPASARKPAA